MEGDDVPKPISVTTKKACAKCLSLKDEMSHCGKCKRVFYCGKKCQQEDWKEHKLHCITEYDLSKLIKAECDGVVANPAFSALVGCVRRYNAELSTLKEDERGFGRRVGIMVEVKKDMKIPAQMAAKMSGVGEGNPNLNAYQCLVGDIHMDDFDEKGTPNWEVMFTPSRGEVGVRLTVTDMEPVDNSLYNEYHQRGILDGETPVVLFANGELMPVQEGAKPYPFPSSEDSGSVPQQPDWSDAVREEDEEREMTKDEMNEHASKYWESMQLKPTQLQGDESFWSFCKLHFEKITRMMQEGDAEAVFLFSSMVSRGDTGMLATDRKAVMKAILPKLLVPDMATLDEKRTDIKRDCEKMSLEQFKTLVATMSNQLRNYDRSNPVTTTTNATKTESIVLPPVTVMPGGQNVEDVVALNKDTIECGLSNAA